MRATTFGRSTAVRPVQRPKVGRVIAALAIVAVVFAAGGGSPAGAAALPPVKHVFVVVLENENHDTTFGPNSKAPYLANDVTDMGQHLTQYYGIGHFSLDNYIAMVSGQAPNPQTQGDCPIFTEMLPGVVGPDGQAIGQGCVHPTAVKTIGDQLTAKGLTWKAYLESMGTACRHPDINTQDNTQTAKKGDQYAARHNPFVYFHSIIDTPACAANDVDLQSLTGDLASPAKTASLSMIVPDLCHDGHDEPCVDGQPGGLVSANRFLEEWIPKILASAAYRDGGLLVIMFDEAKNSDTTACCGEMPGPNSPLPGQQGPGGGRVGAVLISQFIKPGAVNATPYNHYSLLRSVEDLFGLEHLGMAGAADLKAFGDDVFTNPLAPAAVTPAPLPRAVQQPALPATGSASWPIATAAGLLLAAALVIRGRASQPVVATARRARRRATTARRPPP
jgi:LPXTG-motif cell wall-anchored protein